MKLELELNLAPCVYRVAIANNRIVNTTDDKVLYRVKPSGKQQFRTAQLDGEPFVRSFAQHILPPGFQKVRYYGFMSPNNRLILADELVSVVAFRLDGLARQCRGTLLIIRTQTTDL